MERAPQGRVKDLTGRLMGPRGSVRAEIAQGAAGSLALKVVGLGLKLVTGVLLARLLGAEGLGTYAFALAVVGLLQIPTQLGLPQLVTREVAALRERGQWGLLRGLLTRANQGVGLLGILMAVAAFVVAWVFLREGDSPRLAAFWVALPLLPIVALSSLRQATLLGLRHVVHGQIPESLVQPGTLALALGGGYLILGAGFLTPTGAVWLNVGAALIAFATGAWFLVRRLPAEVRTHEPEYRSRTWLQEGLPFMMLAGLAMVNDRLALVMLGVFRTDAEVGVYQVCLLAAWPVAFGLQAAGATVAPHLARLWVRRDLPAMQRVVTGAARISLAVAVPLGLVLLLFGGLLLAMLFGEEFRSGRTALAIVVLGQLLNAGFGSVGLILNMTGHTGLAVRGFLAAVAANVVLNLVLIPRMGIEGAALGALLAFVVWNTILFLYVRREVGVISLAFGGRRWGPKVDPREGSGGAEG